MHFEERKKQPSSEEEGHWIATTRLLLVPFQRHHCAKYFSWLQNEETLRDTGTTEGVACMTEVEDIQKTWEEKKDRMLYLLVDRKKYESIRNMEKIKDKKNADLECLIGDIGFILLPREDALELDSFNNGELVANDADYDVELDLMIAELAYRRQGLAREACEALMRHMPTLLAQLSKNGSSMGVWSNRFLVKIKDWNVASLRLFEGLGFVTLKVTPIFNEIWLVRDGQPS